MRKLNVTASAAAPSSPPASPPDGAAGAADAALQSNQQHPPQLALLISCVGRRLILGQRVEEELESVTELMGDDCHYCGFYSYGEISPLVPESPCKLHNQTMTITTLSEVCDA